MSIPYASDCNDNRLALPVKGTGFLDGQGCAVLMGK